MMSTVLELTRAHRMDIAFNLFAPTNDKLLYVLEPQDNLNYQASFEISKLENSKLKGCNTINDIRVSCSHMCLD